MAKTNFVCRLRFLARSSGRTLALILLMLPLCVAATPARSGQTKEETKSAQQPAPETVLLRLFDYLDEDADGLAPLAAIFDALDMKNAEARQVNRMRAMDRNSDGQVTRDEIVAGVKAEIAYHVQRRLNTDADGNGELSLTEHALAIADPNGKADADGVTPAGLQSDALRDGGRSGDQAAIDCRRARPGGIQFHRVG